jgi:PPOX class probable F420-dependent enzyme
MKFPKDIVEFLKKPNYAILSEHNPDGSIHSTIIWYEFEPRKNIFRFSTTGDRIKPRNLSSDPRITLLILAEGNMYQYVQVNGKVTSSTRKGAYDFIDSEAKRYMGEDKYPYEPERDKDRITYEVMPEKFFSVGFDSSKSLKRSTK